MRRALLLVLLVLTVFVSGCSCGLTNAQSEWTTSEGGEQKSTLTDNPVDPNGDACGCYGGYYGYHFGWHHH